MNSTLHKLLGKRLSLIPHIHTGLPHSHSHIPSWAWKTRLNLFLFITWPLSIYRVGRVQHFWDISHKLWRAISRPAVLLNSGIQSCYYVYMNTSLSACHNDSASVCADAQNKAMSSKAAPAPFLSSGPFNGADNYKSISPCKWFCCPAGCLIAR